MYKPLLASALFLPLPMTASAGNGSQVEAAVSAEIGVDTERNYKLSPQTYEVSYDGRENESRQDVFDRALHEAAKKTISEGYVWFRIVDRETEKETTTVDRGSRFHSGFHTVPERSCGLLGCTTRTQTYYRGSIDAGLPEREDTTYTVTLDIELGSGPAPDPSEVYYAQRINASNS